MAYTLNLSRWLYATLLPCFSVGLFYTWLSPKNLIKWKLYSKRIEHSRILCFRRSKWRTNVKMLWKHQTFLQRFYVTNRTGIHKNTFYRKGNEAHYVFLVYSDNGATVRNLQRQLPVRQWVDLIKTARLGGFCTMVMITYCWTAPNENSTSRLPFVGPPCVFWRLNPPCTWPTTSSAAAFDLSP